MNGNRSGWRGERRRDQRGAVLIFSLVLLVVMTLLGISGMGGAALEERMSGNFYQSYTGMQAAEFGLRQGELFLDAAVANGVFTAETFDVLRPSVIDPTVPPSRDNFYAISNNLGLYWNFYQQPSAYSGGNNPYRVCRNPANNNLTCMNGGSPTEFDPRAEAQWSNAAVLPGGFITLGQTIGYTTDTGAYSHTFGGVPVAVAQQPRLVIEYLGRAGPNSANLVLGSGSTASAGGQNFSKYAFRITAIGWGRDAAARYVLQSHYLVTL